MTDTPSNTANGLTFNARDTERSLNAMRSDVIWANGMEGGYVCGHAGVREYWTRQWQLVDPHVEPKHFNVRGNQAFVDVHQIVRDMKGVTQSDQMVKHEFTLDGRLIMKFEIASALRLNGQARP